MENLDNQVAERAYYKYLERGCENGYDQQDWYEAEDEIVSSKKKVKTSKKNAKKPATKSKKK